MKAKQISNCVSLPENGLHIKIFFYLRNGEVKVFEYLFEDGDITNLNTDELASQCYRDAVTKVDKSEVLLEYRKIKRIVSGKLIDIGFKYLPLLKTEKGYVTVEAY